MERDALSVVYADDDAIMRSAFRKLMNESDISGYYLAADAANGAEALGYIETRGADIVITDLVMPVMDGLELIERLQNAGFDGVVYALSNYSDFELVRTALTTGAADYALKADLDAETLAKLLASAACKLEQKRSKKTGGESVEKTGAGDLGEPDDSGGQDVNIIKREVRDALRFIHEHITEKIALGDVARAVNLNGSYLCRLFKAETGENMFAYISDLRMRRAAALIRSGGMYVREVATAVGIDDQFFFARVFKKRFGMTPSQYAKSVGKPVGL